MKKIIAVLALIGLVIWGMYDIRNTNLTNTKTAEKTPTEVKSVNSQETPMQKIGLQKGNLPPDFELRTPEGQIIRLSDLKGKKVILNFWATWCPPCRLEMPDMEKFYKKQKSKGIEILAVNLTKTEKKRTDVPDFIKAYGITFPVLLDEETEVAQMYQVSSIPTSYLIDSDGVIREKLVGPMNEDMMTELLSRIK